MKFSILTLSLITLAFCIATIASVFGTYNVPDGTAVGFSCMTICFAIGLYSAEEEHRSKY